MPKTEHQARSRHLGRGAARCTRPRAFIWSNPTSQGRVPDDAFAYGMAAGAATVLPAGTGLCRREDVERLYADILQKPQSRGLRSGEFPSPNILHFLPYDHTSH